jgi:hypothetical protein
MFVSQRFNGLEIVLTIHAQPRAQERNMSE